MIAANAALGTWEKENYLTLPFNDLDRVDFTTSLMRYYAADTPDLENKAFKRLLKTLPSESESKIHLHKPLKNITDNLMKTVTVKNELGHPGTVKRKFDGRER